jgi:MOSC domain-containing protein YiiM
MINLTVQSKNNKAVDTPYVDGFDPNDMLDIVTNSTGLAGATAFVLDTGRGKMKETYTVTETASYIAGLVSSVTTTRDKGMSGDMVMVITPGTVNRAATAAAWTRSVVISIETAAGDVHAWLNQAYAASLAIADTSAAGTATIVSTTLTLVNGQATIVVSGDAAAWLAVETDTLTVSNLTVMGYTITGGTSVQTFV